MLVGEVGVRCPECEDIVLVSVELFLVADDESEEPSVWGGRWATKVDDADLWVHVWSHDEELVRGE